MGCFQRGSREVAVLIGVMGMACLSFRTRTYGEERTLASFSLTSPAFSEGEAIPSQHTCDGANGSPRLQWTDPPAGTKSFACISDDPDAKAGTWVHWVVYHIPPSVRELPEAMPADVELTNGTRQGMTDFGLPGYGGPCPPSGTHRYCFTLYALDTTLSLPLGATKRQLEDAMQGHIVAQATLMGTYRRQRQSQGD